MTERDKQISDAWEAGESARVIGARLGISGSRVVQICHRLGLPRRPSPISAQIKLITFDGGHANIAKGSALLHQRLWREHPHILRKLGAVPC